MKRLYIPFQLVVLASAAFLLLGGCQDQCTQTLTYTIYEPVYMSKSEFYSAARVETPRQLGKPGKIYIKGNYLFINETGKGIHIINNQNPVSPKSVSFVAIPGNVDMAVKGNILYADSKMDFLAIDITNPQDAQIIKRIKNVFPYTQYYPGPWVQSASIPVLDTSRIIVDWVKREEKQVSSCNPMPTGWFTRGGTWFFAAMADRASTNTGGPSSGGTGKAGSTARFAIKNSLLYTVDNSTLRLFNITQPSDPTLQKEVGIGGGIETIFPYKEYLFFGTTTGMLIYNATDPENISYVGSISHFFGCDPVVVEGSYAYVTIKGGATCQSEWESQLEVIDISNITNPTRVETYRMEDPNGLGIDGNTLFICDGKAGLKVYNAADKLSIDKNLLSTQKIHAYDVIPYNNTALVIGDDGLYQYDYSDPKNLKLLSVIPRTEE
jgi:hypothetical protein